MVHCLVDHDFWSFVLLLLGYIGWCQEGDNVHSCSKAHIQHVNIIIWLVVPHYLMWTIWWDWNTWTYIHVVLWFFWGSFTFMIVILYEALHFNATLLYQNHFILRKKLCLIIHFIGLVVFLDYFSVQIQNQYAIVLCTKCLLLCLLETRDGRWSHGFHIICVND